MNFCDRQVNLRHLHAKCTSATKMDFITFNLEFIVHISCIYVPTRNFLFTQHETFPNAIHLLWLCNKLWKVLFPKFWLVWIGLIADLLAASSGALFGLLQIEKSTERKMAGYKEEKTAFNRLYCVAMKNVSNNLCILDVPRFMELRKLAFFISIVLFARICLIN